MWEVNLVDAAGDRTVRYWNVPDGVMAITTARRLHADPDRSGSVYVFGPKGSVWLVEDNGLRRVGF
jgi:hypothetical protein